MKNAFLEFTEKYNVRLDDKMNVALYDKDNNTLAIDKEREIVLSFSDELDSWLMDYGAIPLNAGPKSKAATDANKTVRGGSLKTEKQAAAPGVGYTAGSQKASFAAMAEKIGAATW